MFWIVTSSDMRWRSVETWWIPLSIGLHARSDFADRMFGFDEYFPPSPVHRSKVQNGIVRRTNNGPLSHSLLRRDSTSAFIRLAMIRIKFRRLTALSY